MAGRGGAGVGVLDQQSTRPQTLGYGLVDSPAGQAAWIVEKFWAWTDHDGSLERVISRDDLLDDLMLYWLPGTAASSARLYWESFARCPTGSLGGRTPLTFPPGARSSRRRCRIRLAAGPSAVHRHPATGASRPAAATSPRWSSRNCSSTRSGRSSGS